MAAKLGSGATLAEARRGKLILASDLAPQAFFALRSIDNLYSLAAELSVGPHRADLHDLEAAVADLDLSAAASAAGLEPARPVSIFVNASRAGKQTYSRFELAAAATRGMLARQRRWVLGAPDAHEAEFRLDLVGDHALLSLRLTPPSFRFRGDTRHFSEAALRPTVAHALVWLSRPHAGDRFLDPFCGSGTIVAERAAYPSALLAGSDIADEAVSAARANAPPAVAINRWDARALPLDGGSVDTVVTNLPFGRQILTSDDIGPLYRDFCRELRRILAATGQAWLLTDQADELDRAVAAAGLVGADLRQLSLKGLHPHLFRVTRA